MSPHVKARTARVPQWSLNSWTLESRWAPVSRAVHHNRDANRKDKPGLVLGITAKIHWVTVTGHCELLGRVHGVHKSMHVGVNKHCSLMRMRACMCLCAPFECGLAVMKKSPGLLVRRPSNSQHRIMSSRGMHACLRHLSAWKEHKYKDQISNRVASYKCPSRRVPPVFATRAPREAPIMHESYKEGDVFPHASVQSWPPLQLPPASPDGWHRLALLMEKLS